MSDKWRFDPNMDYTEDDGDYNNNGRGNFQRFTKKKNKKNRSNEEEFNKDIKKHKHPSWR